MCYVCFCGFTFKHDAISERAELCIDVAIRRFVATEMCCRETEMRERVTNGEFECSGIASARRIEQALRESFRLCVGLCGGRVLRLGPIIGGFVEAEVSLPSWTIAGRRPLPCARAMYSINAV